MNKKGIPKTLYLKNNNAIKVIGKENIKNEE